MSNQWHFGSVTAFSEVAFLTVPHRPTENWVLNHCSDGRWISEASLGRLPLGVSIRASLDAVKQLVTFQLPCVSLRGSSLCRLNVALVGGESEQDWVMDGSRCWDRHFNQETPRHLKCFASDARLRKDLHTDSACRLRPKCPLEHWSNS